MTELETNLRNILNEKETKILPENIKAGVTIFGVTGTYKCSNSSDSSNYTVLEYLKTDGGQYIDTGVLTKSDLKIVMDCILTTNQSTALFGSRETDAKNRLCCLYYRSNELYYYYAHSGYPYTTLYNLSNRNTYEVVDNILYINSSQAISVNHVDFLSTFPIYLFASNEGGNALYNSTVTFYSCRIEDNGELVRDFIPVKDSNGVACLYDKVTEQFFYNQGIRDFIIEE